MKSTSLFTKTTIKDLYKLNYTTRADNQMNVQKTVKSPRESIIQPK